MISTPQRSPTPSTPQPPHRTPSPLPPIPTLEEIEAWLLDPTPVVQTHDKRNSSEVRLVTWNIQKAADVTTPVLELLQRYDVVCLQELRRPPHGVCNGLGKVITDTNTAGTRGALLAISHRLSPLIEQTRVSGSGLFAAALLNLPSFGRMWVLSIYSQRATLHEIATVVDELAADFPIVIGGDWNAAITELDYGGLAVRPLPDQWLLDHIARGTLVDVWRVTHPCERQYTRKESRLDYFLTSPAIARVAVESSIVRRGGSDHLPVDLCLRVKLPTTVPAEHARPQGITKEGWERVRAKLAAPPADHLTPWERVANATRRLAKALLDEGRTGRSRQRDAPINAVHRLAQELKAGSVTRRAMKAAQGEVAPPVTFLRNAEGRVVDTAEAIAAELNRSLETATPWAREPDAEVLRKGINGQLAGRPVPEVTAQLLRDICAKSKLSKATGPDGVNCACLAKAPAWVLEAFAAALNNAIATGSCPAWVGCSQVTFVLKPGGDPLQATAYRPIAVSTTAAKLLGAVLQRALTEEVAGVRATLLQGQHGFLQGGTTLPPVREAQLTLRQNAEAYLLRLDIAKAFDAVTHAGIHTLLNILGAHHTLTAAVSALYGFTTVRPRVHGRVVGVPLRLRVGLRQGCPASPVLFALYLAPLLNLTRAGMRVPHSLKAYADDVHVAAAGPVREALHINKEFSRLAAPLGMFVRSEKVNLVVKGGPVCQRHGVRMTPWTADQPVKVLGHLIGPTDGCITKGLVTEAEEFFARLPITRTTRRGVQVITRTFLIPRLAYRGAAVEDINCLTVTNKVVRSKVAALLGFPAYTPSEAVFGPEAAGGLGLPRLDQTVARERLVEWAEQQWEAPKHPSQFIRSAVTALGLSLGPSSAEHPPKVELLPPLHLPPSATSEVVVYTDGSLLDNGHGGWAAAFGNGLVISGSLTGCSSSWEAELAAMAAAVEAVAPGGLLNAGANPLPALAIFTDSRAAAATAARKTRRRGDPPAAVLLQSVPHLSVNWVKGHSGVEGNERADTAARQAAARRVTGRWPGTRAGPAAHLPHFINKPLHRWSATAASTTTNELVPMVVFRWRWCIGAWRPGYAHPRQAGSIHCRQCASEHPGRLPECLAHCRSAAWAAFRQHHTSLLNTPSLTQQQIQLLLLAKHTPKIQTLLPSNFNVSQWLTNIITDLLVSPPAGPLVI